MTDEIVRVDQAGEYGACCLYEGQLKALGESHEQTPLLKKMLLQEQDHLRAFNHRIITQAIRPSLLQPLWHAGGYFLGYLSAKISPYTAHAVTMAVEEVIQTHYQEQEETLKDLPFKKDLLEEISRFKEDEKHHEEEAKEAGGPMSPAYDFVHGATKLLTKVAIAVAKKI